MYQTRIGDEMIREDVAGEQYTVRPIPGYFINQNGDQYEIVIEYEDDKWMIHARVFTTEGTIRSAEGVERKHFEMIPKILARFGRTELFTDGWRTRK